MRAFITVNSIFKEVAALTDKQNESEIIYRLGVIVLGNSLHQGLICEEEYDVSRTVLAKNSQASFGLLEAEDRLWKKEL